MQYYIGPEPARKNARRTTKSIEQESRFFGDKFYRNLVNVAVNNEKTWVSADWPTTGHPIVKAVLLNRNGIVSDVLQMGTLEAKRFYSTLFVRFTRVNKPQPEPESTMVEKAVSNENKESASTQVPGVYLPDHNDDNPSKNKVLILTDEEKAFRKNLINALKLENVNSEKQSVTLKAIAEKLDSFTAEIKTLTELLIESMAALENEKQR